MRHGTREPKVSGTAPGRQIWPPCVWPLSISAAPECAAADEIQRVLGAFEGLRNHMPELWRHEALLSPRLREEKIALGRKLALDEFRAACRAADKAPAAARPTAARRPNCAPFIRSENRRSSPTTATPSPNPAQA